MIFWHTKRETRLIREKVRSIQKIIARGKCFEWGNKTNLQMGGGVNFSHTPLAGRHINKPMSCFYLSPSRFWIIMELILSEKAIADEPCFIGGPLLSLDNVVCYRGVPLYFKLTGSHVYPSTYD